MDNLTAKVSCFARAYHYKNNPEHIFADDVAEKLLGNDYELVAQSMSQGISFFLPGFQGAPEEGLRLIVEKHLSPSVLGRSAFCESMLGNEKRLGCSQYVIFASGYDTFAIRNKDTSLSVFELDLPEMLSDKQHRIEKAELSSNATYVPCDLSDPTWKDKLIEAGFRPDRKSFASLLGISYYLAKEDFKSLLQALGSILREGSAICFDYPTIEDSKESQTNQTLAAGAGEQMKAQYSQDSMTK
ncbi:MAG: class I SAM-dependent methyltransferase, partial [Clostridiales bacterium]|nr:class I SAM-dependent methyltransferase [Clostridiales bacterium]